MSLSLCLIFSVFFFFFQAEDGIRDWSVTGVQTCALPISIQLRREGRDIISLSVGEPDFPVFPHVEAAISEALRKGQTKYTAPNGTVELREAISDWMHAQDGVRWPAGQIVAPSGANQAPVNARQALLDEGDEPVNP